MDFEGAKEQEDAKQIVLEIMKKLHELDMELASYSFE
jgi:hypothetical protein